MITEEVFKRHRGFSWQCGLLLPFDKLRANSIILGDGGTCQFVVTAYEVGGHAVDGLFDAVAVAVVDERRDAHTVLLNLAECYGLGQTSIGVVIQSLFAGFEKTW